MADVLRSQLLSAQRVAHGFSLRTGGVSDAPFDTLNVGRGVGDDPECVAENRLRIAGAIGYESEELFETSQVHGVSTVRVLVGDDPVPTREREADALIAPQGGVAVGVRVADCGALLVFDEVSGAVAAIHAGWRGVEAGVVEAGVRALLDLGGGRPAALYASLFPHIGPCCFEVGEDVAERLAAVSPDPSAIDRSRAKPHVDLGKIIVAKLAAMRLFAKQIERVPGCTRCDAKRFFSYRRDGERSGRHLAAIVSR